MPGRRCLHLDGRVRLVLENHNSRGFPRNWFGARFSGGSDLFRWADAVPLAWLSERVSCAIEDCSRAGLRGGRARLSGRLWEPLPSAGWF